jgi:primosomal replication protein N
MELSIRAAGPLAERLDRVALGVSLSMQGFLAPRSRNGKGLILHLTQFEIALAAPVEL